MSRHALIPSLDNQTLENRSMLSGITPTAPAVDVGHVSDNAAQNARNLLSIVGYNTETGEPVAATNTVPTTAVPNDVAFEEFDKILGNAVSDVAVGLAALGLAFFAGRKSAGKPIFGGSRKVSFHPAESLPPATNRLSPSPSSVPQTQS